MTTTTKPTKKQLIKRLHTLRSVVGMTQYEYDALLESYGVASSTELEEGQLEALCRFLQGQAESQHADHYVQRKRLLSAVLRLCEETTAGWEQWDQERRIDYAKGVACRAAGMERWNGRGRDNFNALGLDRMRSLTYAFNKRRKDINNVINAITGQI